jgi:pimeloyl-ACP methyl ester carboxylesterase
MPRILFKGVEIHYEEHGSGSTVLLIHGFLESTWMWKDIAPELAKQHRVIVIDLPGHGKSESIGYVHTMEEMAEACHTLMKSLRIRKVSLVGHSMGGYVALAFAEQYPDKVRTLVLYQSTARADSEWKKKDRQRAIELIKKNHQSFIRQSIPMLFRSKNRKRLAKQIKELKNEALKTSKQGVIAALTGMKDRPNREVLLKFSPYPVHIIASDMDPRIPLEESKYLESISEDVQLHLIKGSGHMSYLEDPESTIILLKKCL